MNSKRGSRPLVVVHVPAGGGHRAAAQAIAEQAECQGGSAVVIDALDLAPSWFRTAYVSTHLGSTTFVPTLYGGAYFASNHRSAAPEELRRAFDRMVGGPLLAAVRRLEPCAVIGTHFYPLTVLGDARQRGVLNIPVLGVVTDYAAHAVWAEPGADAMCVPAGQAVDDLVRHGVEPDRIWATGIPVRPSFGRALPFAPPAAHEPLRVLVTCGGFGVGPMLDVLRSFTGLLETQLTVVCGNNPGLVARARDLAARRALDAEVIGFESDMPSRVANAHVVVGKPGGLTVSECMAAGRPMALVGAVLGQETRNQHWLVRNGAALVLSPKRMGPTLYRLAQEGRLADFAAAARAIGSSNAAREVVELAWSLSRRQRSAAA